MVFFGLLISLIIVVVALFLLEITTEHFPPSVPLNRTFNVGVARKILISLVVILLVALVSLDCGVFQ